MNVFDSGFITADNRINVERARIERARMAVQ